MFVYRLLLALIAPLFALWALSKVLRGQEGWRDAGERLGLVMCRTRGPSLWLHAASNGELASAASVVRLLRAADPQLHIVVTTNSVTGRALAQSWGLEQVHAQLAPFDARWCAARLIARTGVVGLVIMEAEFWPNRIAAIAKARLPVVILGARLSRKSAKGWRRMSFLAEPVLSRISWLVPQDHGSARRLRKLGLAGERIDRVTNLKALYAPPPARPSEAALQEAYPRAATWLAASTHEGEEAFVLAAHKAAMARVAGLQLIIAPRHMNRASAIGKLAREMGLDVARRSAGDAPRSGAVYIADTMGEMALFYDQAHICLVGGSIVDRGGHTPFEPIAHECVILHGPHISNFQNIYRRLDAGGGAFQIGDVDEMAYLLAELQDPGRQDASRNLARELAAVEGAPDALVAKLLGLMGRR